MLTIVESWKSVYFLTLTLKNIPDNLWGRYNVEEIREAFSKLRRRFKSIAGGFYVIQATNRGKGWHLHIHALFDGSYISQKALSKAWLEITGSYIVGIELVQDPKKAVHYLLMDFLQAPRIRPEDAAAFNGVFRGSRLVQPFGLYRKTKFKIPYKCPDCGNDTWVCLDALFDPDPKRMFGGRDP
jgi:hypothetical protein